MPDLCAGDWNVTWAEWVVKDLTPAFGGFVSFVLDPDELLEEPEVRDGLAQAGVQVSNWDGTRSTLDAWLSVDDDQRPLVIVGASQPTHLISEVIPGSVILDTSIAKVFRRVNPDIVKATPRDRWDILYKLQTLDRPLRSPQESAIAVSRAVYGIDPLYAEVHGWESAIARVAVSHEALPYEIAAEIVPSGKADVLEALTDLAVARKLSPKTVTQRSNVLLTAASTRPYSATKADLLIIDELEQGNLSAAQILEAGLVYGRLCANGLPESDRIRANAGFLSWMRTQYDLALTSPNPNVLTLHKLVDTYIKPADKVMMVIVDGMGVEAWGAIREVFESARGLKVTSQKAAFSIVPTITTWARRAIFERTLPPQFSSASHSQALERQLWETRVRGGLYCSLKEKTRISDALCQGKPLAVVDVSWDDRGHSIDADTESISEVAASWASKCAVAEVIREAITFGYRVVVTSDHGQAVGRGIGLPNLGNAIETRSKRCLLFSDSASLHSVKALGIADFKPMSVGSKSNILYAPNGSSFHHGDSSQVSHGGLSLEEVIVPVMEFGK